MLCSYGRPVRTTLIAHREFVIVCLNKYTSEIKKKLICFSVHNLEYVYFLLLDADDDACTMLNGSHHMTRYAELPSKSR